MLESKDFRFSLWQVFLPCMLYESLTNILELKDFHFSLWQVFLSCMFLYEIVGEPNILSNLVVGEPGSQIPVRPWRLY